jgi:diadenylate cyclase
MGYNFVEYVKNFDWYAAIDFIVVIALLAVLTVFFVYKRNVKVLLLILSMVVLEVLVNVLAEITEHEVLTVSRYLLHYVVIGCIVMSAVVYQSDLKSIFQKVSSSKGFGEASNSDDELRDSTTEILTACQNMAKQDVGAIIIIDTKGDIHANILETGTRLDATLSAPLLESIFNTKAPLHDGAVIVRGNKLVAAGCFLTLTQRNVNKELGTRHRAAIGITEDTDVLSIVVSEETGIISVVKHGEIRRYMTMDRLKDEIEEAYNISPSALAKRQAADKRHHGRM